MIPAATYPARATGEYELGVSNNGTEQVGVSFRITQGEHLGTTLTWYGFFNTDENAQRAIKSLRACGWAGDDLSNLQGIDTNEVNIVVEIDEYEGQQRNKVAWVNGAGVAMKNVMNDAQKKAFAARMKGLVLASKGSVPATRAPAPKPQAPQPTQYGTGNTSNDIPF